MRTLSKKQIGLSSLVLLVVISAFFGVRWATFARPPLPEANEALEGGDHHQFGSYEIKPQEHHATIARAAQQEQIIAQTLNLLRAASETK